MLNFLIRIKGEDKQIVSLYPLIYTILKQNQQNRINIIVDEEYIQNQLFLPKGVRTYNIPKSKVDGVFGVHHFAANLHEVFNVDYFIDYICDFHSAFIGLAFKAKKRIGLAGGPKSYFYTHTIPSFGGLFDDEKLISVRKLIPEIENAKPFEFKIETVREFNLCFIDLSDFQQELYLKRLEVLLEIIELPIFYYIPPELEEVFVSDESEVLKNIKAKGQVFTDPIESLADKIINFEIVITNNYLFSIFCHLYNRRVLFICDQTFVIPNCRFIDLQTLVLQYSGADLFKYGIGELKDMRIPSEIFDYLLNFYSLRIEPS